MKKKFGSATSTTIHENQYSGERHEIAQTVIGPSTKTSKFTNNNNNNNNNLQNIKERIKDAFENKNNSGLDDLFVVPRSPETDIQPSVGEREKQQDEVQVYVVDDLGRKQHPQDNKPLSKRDFHHFQETQNENEDYIDRDRLVQSNTRVYEKERTTATTPENIHYTEPLEYRNSSSRQDQQDLIVPRSNKTEDEGTLQQQSSSASSIHHYEIHQRHETNTPQGDPPDNNMFNQQQDSPNETTDQQHSSYTTTRLPLPEKNETNLPPLYDSSSLIGKHDEYHFLDNNKHLTHFEDFFERSASGPQGGVRRHDYPTDSKQVSMAFSQKINSQHPGIDMKKKEDVYPTYEISSYRNDGQRNDDGTYSGPNKASEDISRLVVIDKEARTALTAEIKGFYDRVEIEGVKKYVCKLCQKTFERWCNLNAHVTMHLALKPYVCKLCGAKYKLRSILNDHIRVSHLHRTTKYKCQTCKMDFKKQSSLFKHAAETRHTI